MSDVITELAMESNDKAAEIARLKAENAKLRELAKRMARALGVGSNLCDRNCGWEFECDMVSCPIEEAMRDLGVGVAE